MPQITAVIVEDEENGVLNLVAKLNSYCPEVEIVGTCHTAEEGIRTIQKQKPDLVFLDIMLGPVNGFDMLVKLEHIDFELIITTDYNSYGIDAVKANALDYLLKPINTDELVQAVGVAASRKRAKEQDAGKPRIAIPITHGYRLVGLDEILYVEANDQRSIFHLFNREKVDTARVLGKVFLKLEQFNFCRIHRSFVINIDYVDKIIRKDGGYVVMSNGDQLRVAKGYDCPGLLLL